MNYRELGESGLKVSEVTLGCWAIAGDATWGPQDHSDAEKTLQAALDYGINSLDTAPGYGDGASEEFIGRKLPGRRDEWVIATKISPGDMTDVKRACEDSLRRLRTDYIDIYYIHWPSRDIPIDETLSAMEALKQEGKVRVLACSNFGKLDLAELLERGRVEVNQLAYNLLFRAVEYEIQGACQEHGVSIACYSPIAQGLLTGKFSSADEVPAGRARTRHFSKDRPQAVHSEDGAEKETFDTICRIEEICRDHGISMLDASIGWLLTRPGVATVIAGARNPQQVKDNAKAATTQLPSEVVDQLSEATESLKEKLGPNADMWRTQSRIR